MKFYFLEEETSVDALKLSSGIFSQKTFRKECTYLSHNETRHFFSWKVELHSTIIFKEITDMNPQQIPAKFSLRIPNLYIEYN